jgi:ParB-like chromosome segregation protein Spo0J
VVTLRVATLLPGESPRLAGLDKQHIERLAEIDTPLPPILVDHARMKVIDGMHRLMAALSKGKETIEAELFEGSEADAFLLGVEANVAHGFPLSQVDRRAAAKRIIGSHPHMSDRAIAQVSGLSAKTVAAIRRDLTGHAPELAARLGRDGKVRPLNSAEGRRRAAELIAANPGASLREIARDAGISLGTVSDVRRRLDSGEHPVPPRFDTTTPNAGQAARAAAARRRARHKRLATRSDPGQLLDKLVRDPSLRFRDGGRRLLRLLQQNAIDAHKRDAMIAAVPPHCDAMVVVLAERYAQMWIEFAQQVEGQLVARSPR